MPSLVDQSAHQWAKSCQFARRYGRPAPRPGRHGAQASMKPQLTRGVQQTDNPARFRAPDELSGWAPPRPWRFRRRSHVSRLETALTRIFVAPVPLMADHVDGEIGRPPMVGVIEELERRNGDVHQDEDRRRRPNHSINLLPVAGDEIGWRLVPKRTMI